MSVDVGELSLRHPEAGTLELSYERVLLPSDPGLGGLTLWTAPPGSPSHAALRRIAARLEGAASS
ncbi:MmyB family transcriptional regulator [Actinomadura sediminis]|uniref:MmyB-like transcription regulator ligand binding domain-containing protein n=1 Tax=Actinomadura sediminis TaxID=1038904 RepID=A0ABW3EJW2_9ACTN